MHLFKKAIMMFIIRIAHLTQSTHNYRMIKYTYENVKRHFEIEKEFIQT